MPKKQDTSFLDFICDQLASIEGLRTRSMFGGFGIYAGDVFFALIFSSHLYFKVNDDTKKQYIAWGMKPFTPSAKQIMKRYYEVPPDVFEEASALEELAYESIEAAMD